MKTTNLVFKNPKLNPSLATLLLIFVTQFTTAQTVHTVDNRPESGAMYTTVQAAVDAAAAGDIIQIHPSPTSYGNVNVTKEYLTIIGFGHNPVNMEGLRATITGFTMYTSSNNSIIKGLTIGGIQLYGSDIQILNNRITSTITGSNTAGTGDNTLIIGNYLAHGYYSNIGIDLRQSKNWVITNNYLYASYIQGLDQNTIFSNNIMIQNSTNKGAFRNCVNPVATNNIFLFPSTASTGVILSNSTINFTNCLTFSYNFAVSTMADLPGANNFNNTKPIFENAPDATLTAFYDNDYRLAAGSPGENGGFDGTDIGIFGRSFEFDVNGRIDLLPYPTSINIINTVLKPSQDLNVEFSATIKQ